MMLIERFDFLDAYLHIIDPRFALVANQGVDQDCLIDALRRLGPLFVGVTQLPASVNDQRLQALDGASVRALRFRL